MDSSELPPDSADAFVPASHNDPFSGIEAPTEITPHDDVPEARRNRPYYNARAAAEMWNVLRHWVSKGRREMMWDVRRVNMSALSLRQKLTNGLLFLRDNGTDEQREIAYRCRVSTRKNFIVLSEVSPEGDDLLLTATFNDKLGGEEIYGRLCAWLSDPLREENDMFKLPDADNPDIDINDQWAGKIREKFIEYREKVYGSVRAESIKVIWKKQTEE